MKLINAIGLNFVSKYMPIVIKASQDFVNEMKHGEKIDVA